MAPLCQGMAHDLASIAHARVWRIRRPARCTYCWIDLPPLLEISCLVLYLIPHLRASSCRLASPKRVHGSSVVFPSPTSCWEVHEFISDSRQTSTRCMQMRVRMLLHLGRNYWGVKGHVSWVRVIRSLPCNHLAERKFHTAGCESAGCIP